MAEDNFLIGFWKILKCGPETGSNDKKGVQGTIFELKKTGYVTWKVPEDAVSIPLFTCETYRVVSKGPFLANQLHFSTYRGFVFEFNLETCKPDGMLMMLHEGVTFMTCKKLEDVEPEERIELPFSLLPALEDSFFSDFSIVASNSKEFLVHTCILKLSAPEIDWSAKPTPLTGLPEEVIGTILHFLYAQCLPPDMDEEVAKQVISAAPDYPGLEPLVSMCQSYIKNVALKREIMSLFSDMHSCFAQIIDYFSHDEAKNLMSDPVQLCHAVKSSMREVSVATSKVLLLCDLYCTKKDEMLREERHEIMRYAKSRIPVFMGQIERFFQGVKSTFGSLVPLQRQQLACYLVPEMEAFLNTTVSMLLKVKAFLERKLADFRKEDESKNKVKMDNFEQYMDVLLPKRGSKTVRYFLHRITFLLMHIQQKKDNFKAMTRGNKIRYLARNLEELIEGLPLFLLRLEKCANDLNEKMEWNESQFLFYAGVEKAGGVIKKLQAHKDTLQGMFIEMCDLVQRDSFSQALVALGLLYPCMSTPSNASDSFGADKNWQTTPEHHGSTLNLTEYQCKSPPPHRNRLSKAAAELLRSGHGTDMVFEVIPGGEDGDGVIGKAVENPVDGEMDGKSERQVIKIEAHRVIIAARCDWFRRALLSGMQEAINRKIQVHNTSPFLFSLFLEYLYSGRLDYSSLAVEQISELLLLSDRFELDSLKQACEYGLKSHLDDESVLYFFSMADSFNAKILKSACIQFIARNPDFIVERESFKELPDNLQFEIYELVVWGKSQPMQLSSENTSGPYNVPAANLRSNSREPSSRSENEELPLVHDSARLEGAIEQLREIVGSGPSRSRLVQDILAADYDINRALNLYYSSS